MTRRKVVIHCHPHLAGKVGAAGVRFLKTWAPG